MSQQRRAKIVGLIVVVLLSTVATTGIVLVKDNRNSSVMSSTTTQSLATTSTYKDGSYTAQGSFDTPDGTERIGVTIKLSGNNISSVSIDDSSIYSGSSFAYTERFINGIKSVVVGKNIDTVNVGRISGASLTPIGFNTALDTIKNQAKV